MRNTLPKGIKQYEKMIDRLSIHQLNLPIALSGNSFAKISQMINNPMIEKQIQLNQTLSSMSETLKAAKLLNNMIPINFSNLSTALNEFGNSNGLLIAQIDSQMKSFREQLQETTSFLSIPIQNYQSALSCIPDFYSITKIYRDENNNIDIYVKNTHDDEEPEYNINNAKADEGFIKFLHDIPKEHVIRFLTHLQEYPYLALVDEVGKQIFQDVQNKISDYVKTESEKVFYRARAKEKGAPEWTPLQIGEPQYGVPGMGRFNFLGNPLFYVATEIETAKKEVQSSSEPESSVVRFNQIQEMKVFDISTENCPLITYCNMSKQSGNDYTSYLIPNFLSVCCSYLNKKNRHSVDAIKYKSNKCENGYCYVILDKSPKDFFDEGEIVLD